MLRSALILAIFALYATPALAKTDAKAEARAEKGIASIYSTKLVGHATASGALLDSHKMTAAHMRLPFGTKVEVTNRKNGRKVVVTVNDRGPAPQGPHHRSLAGGRDSARHEAGRASIRRASHRRALRAPRALTRPGTTRRCRPARNNRRDSWRDIAGDNPRRNRTAALPRSRS